MRLIGAELLKMRRRMMTYVLLITLISVMSLVFLVVGGLAGAFFQQVGNGIGGELPAIPFNSVYAITGELVFGLGSLLVIIYVGGLVGGDYSWGVLRNAFSRGESRIAYALAKAAALAIVVSIGVTIAFGIGALMVLGVATTARIDLGSPFTADALTDLVKSLGLGLLVLFERGAIGFAVSVLLRSQVAGIVVGVVLYIAEPFISNILTLLSLIGQAGFGTGEPATTPHWSQFLPFSIGSSVLAEGHASMASFSAGLTPIVPIAQALPVLLLYGVIALALACFVMRRQEIVA
jgi:ABC-type transport system involved in multi-copper enzyme maturation permease subunit